MARPPRACCMVLFVVCVAAASPAWGQRFGFGRTNSLPSLAAYEAVQKELGVQGEAAAKLSALSDEYRAASQKEFTALGVDYSALSDLPALERAAEMRSVNEKTASVSRKLAAQFNPKVEAVLTSDQFQRLKQIQLQANGIDVWTEPEFAKELDLTEAQLTQLAALRNEYSRRQQLLSGDFQERFAKIRELNTERDRLAIDLLTPPQQEKLTALKGQPFDVSQISFGRRRGNN
jgi:hypothetical protein